MTGIILSLFANFALCFIFLTHPIFTRVVQYLERKKSIWTSNAFYTGLLFSPLSSFIGFSDYNIFLSTQGYAFMLANAVVTAIIAELVDRMQRRR